MEPLLFCAVALAILLTIAVSSYYNEPAPASHLKKLPGPAGLPIVGYIPFLGKLPYETFTELGKKYGAVFQVRLGYRTVVVLNDRNVIQKAFAQNSALVGRPSVPTLKAFVEGTLNKFADRTGDSVWKFSRKIAIKALAMFASSKNSKLEKLAHSTSDSMAQDFMDTNGSAVDPTETVFEKLTTAIGSMTFGGQFVRNDSWLKHVMTLMTQGSVGAELYKLGSAVDYLPFGTVICRHEMKKAKQGFKVYDDVIQKYIDEHKCNEEVTDLADALHKTAEETTEEELKNWNMTRQGIRYISDDLFLAGFITTVETLRWGLNLLAANQNIQRKLYKELDIVLQGKRPSLEHKSKLPYTEAVLLEVLRFSSLTPLLLYHEAMEETEIEGFYVPKGAIIIPNAWAIHRDESVFQNAFGFQPEHFLDIDGTKIVSEMAQKIMPFGTGKRRCVGENLARQELFLLFAEIFQKFKVEPAPGEKLDLSPSPVSSFIRSPIGQKLVFNKR